MNVHPALTHNSDTCFAEASNLGRTCESDFTCDAGIWNAGSSGLPGTVSTGRSDVAPGACLAAD